MTTELFYCPKNMVPVDEPGSHMPVLSGSPTGSRTGQPGNKVRSRNILVVDDDESVRDLMARVLQADGYTVFRAGNCPEALYFSSHFAGPIHLLLTDFCMQPYQNGLELANLLRESRPEIRVIYASGFVEDNLLQSEIQFSGSSWFLAKPFSLFALRERVRQSLGIPA